MLLWYKIIVAILIVVAPSCSHINHSQTATPTATINDSLVILKLIEKSREGDSKISNPNEIFDTSLKDAEQLALKGNYKNALFNIYLMVGKRYRNRAFYSKSYEYIKRALDLAIELENKSHISECYNQLGVIYRRTGENTIALNMHLKAEQYAEEAKDTFNISVALNGIGNVHLSLDRFQAAIEYFNSAMAISISQNNILGQAINYNNIGEAHLHLGSLDLALDYFFKSLENNSKVESKIGQSICYNSIGETYMAMGESKKALRYLLNALKLTREVGDLLYVSGSLILVGETYFTLGDHNNTIYYLTKGLQISKQIGAKSQAADAAEKLALLYENQGNYKEALRYYKTQSSFKDSLVDEKNIYQISNLEAVYESEKRQQQIDELNERYEWQRSKIDKQKVMIIGITFATTLVLLILFLIVRQSQLKEKYKSIHHKQRLLRSQMNPHFIFNALSAIQVFILEQDTERSSHLLSEFAKLMRQVLRNSNFEYISLKEELDTLEYYIHLQNLRFTPPFEYKVEVDDSFDQSLVMIPPMLTQPFLENSIEHGLKPIGGNGKITLRFLRHKNHMAIEVEDNGIGIGQSKNSSLWQSKHESMALKIVQERLDIIKRDTGKMVHFSIEDKQALDPFSKGTIVRIEIPVIEKQMLTQANNEQD